MSNQADVVIARKIRRLLKGGRPRTLDLFSGCGGLSLGFHAAGFEIVGSVEADPDAARTFAANFGGSSKPGLGVAKDITVMEPEEALKICGAAPGPVQESVDVVVGGPPCQAFARIGRAKLREVRRHPEAFKKDPRAALYLRYLHYVRKTLPVALLLENVPDVLNFGGRNIAEEIVGHLKKLGYSSRYTLLNAAHYGVPQARERMFLVAVHRACAGSFQFPAPSRSEDLPSGYGNLRAVALGTIRLRSGSGRGQGASSFVAPPLPGQRLPAGTTASQALSDLPEIMARRLNRRGGQARFKELQKLIQPYRCSPRNSFQQWMRAWPGFEKSSAVTNHAIRHLPRDFRWFSRMRPGMRYPAIHDIASDYFLRSLLPKLRKQGVPVPPRNTTSFTKFAAKYVPPYDPGKFHDKWRMIEPEAPCHTLLAHLGKDCYSHIHFDCRQARTISVREAARLQSFPDSFRFPGGMNSSFRQIGNAVPPLLSFALACALRSAITGDSRWRQLAVDRMGKEAASGASGRAGRPR